MAEYHELYRRAPTTTSSSAATSAARSTSCWQPAAACRDRARVAPRYRLRPGLPRLGGGAPRPEEHRPRSPAGDAGARRAWSAAEGVRVEWLAADMRDFRLERPVDLAICMFDGLDALLSNDDIVRHFRAVAGNLGPRGLYVLEYTHPATARCRVTATSVTRAGATAWRSR